jgi:phage tail sheath gpL-like
MSGNPISFNTIAVNIRTPGVFVEFDNTRAQTGLAALPHRVLLVGQRLAGGSIAAGVLVKITSAGQGAKYFGDGSMLDPMCDAFILNAPQVEVWAVALNDNGAGAFATGSFTLAGPATANGTLAAYFGGQIVQVGVTAGDTAATMATNTVAAIAATTDLPVSAVVDGVTAAKVNLTARHKGVCGNTIDVRFNMNDGDAFPAGVTAPITAMSGGTANPDINAAIAAIGDVQYTSVVNPYLDNANLTALIAELTSRWGGMSADDGVAWSVGSGSYSAIDTVGSGLNTPFLIYQGNQNSATLPWVQAAINAAIDESEPDPARPRQTLPMLGMLPPAVADRYTRTERNQHLVDGVATYLVDAGGVCRVERFSTTYKTNANGVPDDSYRDVETIRTLSAIRYTVRARIAQKYPRHKLGEDGTIGPNVVTPSSLKNEMRALYKDWMTAGWVQGGQAQKDFNANVNVQIDATNKDQANFLLPPELIKQFRIAAGQVQFS